MDTYRSGRSMTFLLLLVLTVVRIDSLPVSSFFDDDSDYDNSFENEYDLVFDQRQNGTANVHVSVDGVMLALPAPEMPSTASLAGATLLDLFASQLAATGESEYDSSEESYGGILGTTSAAVGAISSTSSTTSTTTVAPESDASIASDFPYQALPANLPASLLGQGLSFFFNPKHGEIPFRLNTEQESTKQILPIIITKVDKAPATRDPNSAESNEDSRELVAPPASQQTPKRQTGKKKQKHKQKYKVRVANLLRPLLKHSVLVQ